MTSAFRIRLGRLLFAGVAGALLFAFAAIPDRPAIAGSSSGAHTSVPRPPLPPGFILRYDFVRKHQRATFLKRGGLLIFQNRHERYVCLGKRRFARLKRRLDAVHAISGSIRGQPHLARSQALNLEWKGKGQWVLGAKGYDGSLPRPAQRLIGRLTSLRQVLRPSANRLTVPLSEATAKRLCDR